MRISKRTLGLLLSASLALNLAGVGVVGGYFLSDQQRSKGPGGAQMTATARRGGPPILGALMSGLDREERRAVLNRIRDRQANLAESNQDLRALRDDIAKALMSDPMDRAEIVSGLGRLQSDLARRRDVTDVAIVDWLETLSLAQRTKIAEALLKPKRRPGRQAH